LRPPRPPAQVAGPAAGGAQAHRRPAGEVGRPAGVPGLRSPSVRQLLPRTGGRQARFADGEVIVARKYQAEGLAVGAHPPGREAGRLAGADVPLLGEVNRRPRPPRLRGVVDGDAALEAGVGLAALRPRDDLHPQVALEAGVVRDAGAVAPPLVGEDRAAVGDVLRPLRVVLPVEAGEELIGVAFLDLPLGHARQHHAIGRRVRAVGIRRVDVHEVVAGAGVVLAEVEERRAAEAGRELPRGPVPRRAVVLRPGELRVAGVARPQIEDAVDAEDAAGFLRPGPVA